MKSSQSGAIEHNACHESKQLTLLHNRACKTHDLDSSVSASFARVCPNDVPRPSPQPALSNRNPVQAPAMPFQIKEARLPRICMRGAEGNLVEHWPRDPHLIPSSDVLGTAIDVTQFLEQLLGVVTLHSLRGDELRKGAAKGAYFAAKTLALPGTAAFVIPEVC